MLVAKGQLCTRSRTPSPEVFDNNFSDFDDGESDDDIPTRDETKQTHSRTDESFVEKENPNGNDNGSGSRPGDIDSIVKPNCVSRQHSDEHMHGHGNSTKKYSKKDGADNLVKGIQNTHTKDSSTEKDKFVREHGAPKHLVKDPKQEADHNNRTESDNENRAYFENWIKTWALDEEDLIEPDRYSDPTIRIDPSFSESVRLSQANEPKAQWTKFQKFPRIYHVRSSRKTGDDSMTKVKNMMSSVMSPLTILANFAEERGKDIADFLDDCDKTGFQEYMVVRFPCMQCHEKQDIKTDPYDYYHGGSSGSYYQDYGKQFGEEDKCKKCGGSLQTMSSFIKMLKGLKTRIRENNLEVHDVYPDGNCLFGAVVDQLRVRGVFAYTVQNIRKAAVKYLSENPMSSDGETHLQLFLTDETWDQYLSRMSKDGEWGDHMILSAIANVTHQRIVIFGGRSGDDQTIILPIDMQEPVPTETKEVSDEQKESTDTAEAVDKNTGRVEEGAESKESKETNGTEEPIVRIFEKKGTLFLAHFGESHYVSLRPMDWQENLLREETDREDDQHANIARPSTQTKPRKTFSLEHIDYFLLQFLQFEYVRPVKSKQIDNLRVDFKEASEDCVGSVVSELSPSVDTVSVQGPDVRVFLSSKTNKVEDSPNQGDSYGDELAVYLHTPRDTVVTTYPNKEPGKFNLIAREQGDSVGLLRLVPCQPEKWKGQTETIGDAEYLSAMDPFPRQRKLLAFSMSWPQAAVSWKTRERSALWPDILTVERIEKDGVHVIPVINASEIKEFQEEFSMLKPEQTLDPLSWAISFSVPERELARCTTKSQRNVFHLFKLLVGGILKTPIFPKTAYKHIFLYACENIPKRTWKLHPGKCLLIILKKLSDSLSSGFIPHYFISANNLLRDISVDDLQIYWRRVEYVRKNPMMSIYFLLDRYNVTSTEIAAFMDDIIEDTYKFQIHGDINRSTLEGFLPASCGLLETFIVQGEYEFALRLILRLKDKMVKTCQGGGPGLAEIVNKGLWNMHAGFRWCLGFYTDINQNSQLSKAMTAGLQSVSITEVFGPEITSLLPDTLILKTLSPQYGELNFPIEMVKVLESAGKVLALSKCLRYYLDTYYDCFGSPDVARITVTMATLLFNLYSKLFDCYVKIDEKNEFRDLLERFMDVGDYVYTAGAFKEVARICTELGELDFAKQFRGSKSGKGQRILALFSY